MSLKNDQVRREGWGRRRQQRAHARLIRLVIGFIANLVILETIGIIPVVIGVVLWILGSMGCQVGGPGGASAR